MCKTHYTIYATCEHIEIHCIAYCWHKPKSENSFSNTDREGQRPRCHDAEVKKVRKKSLDRTRKWLEGENGGGVKVDSPHYVAVIGKVLQLQIDKEIGEESIEEGYQGQRRKRELD